MRFGNKLVPMTRKSGTDSIAAESGMNVTSLYHNTLVRCTKEWKVVFAHPVFLHYDSTSCGGPMSGAETCCARIMNHAASKILDISYVLLLHCSHRKVDVPLPRPQPDHFEQP